MTSDPFPGRCRRCGIGMMVDCDYCGRDECRSGLEALRDWTARTCSALVRAGRWLGLLK